MGSSCTLHTYIHTSIFIYVDVHNMNNGNQYLHSTTKNAHSRTYTSNPSVLSVYQMWRIFLILLWCLGRTFPMCPRLLPLPPSHQRRRVPFNGIFSGPYGSGGDTRRWWSRTFNNKIMRVQQNISPLLCADSVRANIIFNTTHWPHNKCSKRDVPSAPLFCPPPHSSCPYMAQGEKWRSLINFSSHSEKKTPAKREQSKNEISGRFLIFPYFFKRRLAILCEQKSLVFSMNPI